MPSRDMQVSQVFGPDNELVRRLWSLGVNRLSDLKRLPMARVWGQVYEFDQLVQVMISQGYTFADIDPAKVNLLADDLGDSLGDTLLKNLLIRAHATSFVVLLLVGYEGLRTKLRVLHQIRLGPKRQATLLRIMAEAGARYRGR